LLRRRRGLRRRKGGMGLVGRCWDGDGEMEKLEINRMGLDMWGCLDGDG
jgi:hypothetical protein